MITATLILSQHMSDYENEAV